MSLQKLSTIEPTFDERLLYAKMVSYLQSLGQCPPVLDSKLDFFHHPQDPQKENIYNKIQELFNDVDSLKNTVSGLLDCFKANLITKNQLDTISSNMLTMSFAQVTFFKVFPCRRKDASCCSPRYNVTRNMFDDTEFTCPFYHHDRDRRRFVKYLPDRKIFSHRPKYASNHPPLDHCVPLNESLYSQNFFEHQFHPLFYKKFACQRPQCSKERIEVNNHRNYWVVHFALCPFYHSLRERQVWFANLEVATGLKIKCDDLKESQNLVDFMVNDSHTNPKKDSCKAWKACKGSEPTTIRPAYWQHTPSDDQKSICSNEQGNDDNDNNNDNGDDCAGRTQQLRIPETTSKVIVTSKLKIKENSKSKLKSFKNTTGRKPPQQNHHHHHHPRQDLSSDYFSFYVPPVSDALYKTNTITYSITDKPYVMNKLQSNIRM